MPSFSSENERVAIAAVHGALSLCQRVLEHFRLYGAALAVMLIQLLRDPQRCFRRIRRQQFDNFDSVVHPPRGVDSRAKLEADLSGADLTWSNVSDLFEGGNSGTS